MSILGMPERPDLDHFRRQARSLQRAVRAGDADAVARLARSHPRGMPDDPGSLRLAAAQLVVAREYGFASWPRLTQYLDTVTEHGWDSGLGAAPSAQPADEFCRLACLTYGEQDGPARWGQARRLLEQHPAMTTTSIWAAAAAAQPDHVAHLLAERSQRAVERGGPLRWRPLFYLVYARHDPDVPAERVLAVARLLLDAGADPNEGYLFDGLPSPFTLLTGVFGHGELGTRRQPSHPHWPALARLLLDAGADPNDSQTLYNRMFTPDDSHLELLFEYGLGTSGRGPWPARITTLDTPRQMLRKLLRWAVEHHQPGRVRLLTEHGVDIHAPFERDGRTPIELAQLYGDTGITAYLAEHGAACPKTDPMDELIGAAFRADRPALDRIRAEHPDAVDRARQARPGLMVWAATHAPDETVTLLAELGFDVNSYGRGDAPIEQGHATALHHAAGNGKVELTRRLLELGADPNLRDRTYHATPLGWATYLEHPATAELLHPVTTPDEKTDPADDR